MDLRNFLQLLRNHWKLIALVTLITTAGSVALTARMTPMYSSSVTFYVSAQIKTSNDPIAAYEGSLLSQQEVQSYADLLTGPRLASHVVTSLGLPMSAAQLSTEISARPVPQTVLIVATVTDSSASRAQSIANAVGAQFVTMVSSIERPPKGGAPPIRLSVVASAGFPTSPVSPNSAKNIGIAVGLGLLIGIGLAAARRALDTTIKSSHQLGAATGGKPVIGSVPFDRRAHKHPLVSGEGRPNRRVEAYRKIGTNLQFIDIDLPRKVLLVTSALPEEGKSSTVCNLAIVLAQAGKRVVIIEADLRRPRAAGYLGLPNGVGVTSVLVGRVSVSEAIQNWGDDQFAVLTSGPPAPNPRELLGSRRMGELLEQLRASFDVILVDAPPILPFADTAATVSACDGAILVVRHGKTRLDHVRRAAEALSAVSSPLLGSILSMEPSGRRHPEYGYGYGYRRYAVKGDPRSEDAILVDGQDSPKHAGVP